MSAPPGERFALVAEDFRRHGGMDRPNYELAWHLAEREGAAVELIAHRVEPPLRDHPRVRWHAVPRPLGRDLLGQPLLARTGRRVAREVAAAGGRVVVNGGNCPPGGGWGGDVNWVHFVHAACPPPRTFRPAAALRAATFGRWHRHTERRAFDAAGLVLTNSDRTTHDLERCYGPLSAALRRVYLGVDRHDFRPPSRTERAAARAAFDITGDRPVAAFVGGLAADRRKGFDVLYEAWCRLSVLGGSGRDEHWDGRLIVAGAGADREIFQAAAAQDGLTGSIRFLGYTDRVPQLLAAADLLVAPTFYEPYGLGVHEALCRGVPAVVTETAGVAERYPPDLAHLLLPAPPTADGLVERLRVWRGRREETTAAVRDLSERLRARDWEAVAAEIAALIRRCPPNPARGPRSRRSGGGGR